MSTATTAAPKATTQAPKRHREEFDGITLEYIEELAVISTLFGFDKELCDMVPSLSKKTKVRKYLLAGTDVEFNHPLVPKVETHKFDMFELAEILPYFLSGKGFPPYLFGLQGTGKSSTVDQLLARLGLPRVTIILGEDSEVIDLGGQMLPTEAGGMRLSYGLLVQAMKNGWVLIFDEYDLLPLRQQKMLNGVLSDRRFTIEITGEQVEAVPNWRVCAIGNTNNTGGGHAMFAGKTSGDASVNERWNFFQKHYMDREDEKALLMGIVTQSANTHPKIVKIKDATAREKEAKRFVTSMEGMVDTMLNVAQRIRTAHEQSKSANPNGEVLDCTMSYRTLKKWLENVLSLSVFFNGTKNAKILSSLLRRAYDSALVNSVSVDEQEIVVNIYESSIVA